MDKIIKKYSNEDITVVWQPDKCIHSKICWTQMIEVFNPRKKPWIDLNQNSTFNIISQVEKCPSGALSYYKNEFEHEQEQNLSIPSNIIEITENGPILVHGTFLLKDKIGNQTEMKKTTAMCRCGGSSNKPFCDGTHNKINFQG